MLERAELIEYITHNHYNTQKELAELIGIPQRELSRLLVQYELSQLFEDNKAKNKTKVEAEKPLTEDQKRIRASFLRTCQKAVDTCWDIYVAQGGDKDWEQIRHDYQYGITDKAVSLDTFGLTPKGKQVIEDALAFKKSAADLTEDEVLTIGLCLRLTRICFKDRKFGFGVEDDEL